MFSFTFTLILTSITDVVCLHIKIISYYFQERAKAEKINRKLRTQLTDFRVPDVMEYVTEKADLYEIQRKVKNWERKVEIAEV